MRRVAQVPREQEGSMRRVARVPKEKERLCAELPGSLREERDSAQSCPDP